MDTVVLSLNALAYDLFELIRPSISDDDSFDIRSMKYWVLNQRSIWIRNDLNKNGSIDNGIIQDLGCVDVELVDGSSCCTSLCGCKILRTTNKIPATIDSISVKTLTRVAPINLISVPFSYVDYSRAIYSGNGRFNSKTIFAFLKDDYVWLITKNHHAMEYLGITKINIQGVFEDPTLVGAFTKCSGGSCYTDDDPFPIQRWMVEFMKGEILKIDAFTKLKSFGDDKNNASGDDSNKQSK